MVDLHNSENVEIFKSIYYYHLFLYDLFQILMKKKWFYKNHHIIMISKWPCDKNCTNECWKLIFDSMYKTQILLLLLYNITAFTLFFTNWINIQPYFHKWRQKKCMPVSLWRVYCLRLNVCDWLINFFYSQERFWRRRRNTPNRSMTYSHRWISRWSSAPLKTAPPRSVSRAQ